MIPVDVVPALDALDHARDQVDGEQLVERLLSPLFAVDPDDVRAALAAAAATRPIAAFALWQLSAATAVDDVSAQVTAEALVRWQQPEVPGWWDGWAEPAMHYAIDDHPPDMVWAIVKTAIGLAPSNAVLESLGAGVVCEALFERRDEYLPLISADATSDSAVATALRAAEEMSEPPASL